MSAIPVLTSIEVDGTVPLWMWLLLGTVFLIWFSTMNRIVRDVSKEQKGQQLEFDFSETKN